MVNWGLIAGALVIGILTVIAWKDRQQLDQEIRDELDEFLEEVLA